MTPADLARYGHLLTGSVDRWRRPLARLLGVSEGFVRLMERGPDNGGRPVPERIERKLRELAEERRRDLEEVAS